MTSQVERTYQDLVRLSHAGLDAPALRHEVLRVMKRIIPVDAAFFATTDPATLLFTSAFADDVLLRQTPLFLHNEFLQDDTNKFVHLSRHRDHVRSLHEGTNGDLAVSRRYRDILEPVALGDELRAALVVDGACWGVMCLHRERARATFTPAEHVCWLLHASASNRAAFGASCGEAIVVVEATQDRQGNDGLAALT